MMTTQTVQTAIRLPADLIPRLDAIAEKWTKTSPHPASRSDVIRVLLARAVEAEEEKGGRHGR